MSWRCRRCRRSFLRVLPHVSFRSARDCHRGFLDRDDDLPIPRTTIFVHCEIRAFVSPSPVNHATRHAKSVRSSAPFRRRILIRLTNPIACRALRTQGRGRSQHSESRDEHLGRRSCPSSMQNRDNHHRICSRPGLTGALAVRAAWRQRFRSPRIGRDMRIIGCRSGRRAVLPIGWVRVSRRVRRFV